MITLIQDGHDLCPVTQFSYQEGHQEVITINQIGGRPIQVGGRRAPDIITFACTVMPAINSVHQLRDDNGDIFNIQITNITISGAHLFVVVAVLR